MHRNRIALERRICPLARGRNRVRSTWPSKFRSAMSLMVHPALLIRKAPSENTASCCKVGNPPAACSIAAQHGRRVSKIGVGRSSRANLAYGRQALGKTRPTQSFARISLRSGVADVMLLPVIGRERSVFSVLYSSREQYSVLHRWSRSKKRSVRSPKEFRSPVGVRKSRMPGPAGSGRLSMGSRVGGSQALDLLVRQPTPDPIRASKGFFD